MPDRERVVTRKDNAPSTDEAARILGAHDRPVLLRLPFSHFCRKAEWGLTRCGLPYTTIDVALRGMRQVRRANPVEKTVPVLVGGTEIVHGSHAILRWADGRRSPDRHPLYPANAQSEILDWEGWADRTLGAPVRREGYRVLATDPTPYGRTTLQRLRLRLAKPLFRRVLHILKAEEGEAEDHSVLADAIEHTVQRLRQAESGYLYGDHATGADIATAALMEPLVPIGARRGYDQVPGWGEFVQYVRTVRPRRTTRTGKRHVREADWVAFEALNAAATQLTRPLAHETAP